LGVRERPRDVGEEVTRIDWEGDAQKRRVIGDHRRKKKQREIGGNGMRGGVQ